MTFDEFVGTVETPSIRAFVERHKQYLGGRVLDYGSGRQPYRGIVESAGGTYHPYDRKAFPGSVSAEDVGGDGDPSYYAKWDCILCTQVLEYVSMPRVLLSKFHGILNPSGHLLITVPTNHPEIEAADLFRYTESGMKALLRDAGFEVIVSECRGRFPLFNMATGYGMVAKA